MTFAEWIKKVAKAGDNPRGDFIRDTRAVLVRKHNWATCDEFMDFLSTRTNDANIHDLGRAVWADYERWQREAGDR